MGNGFFKFKAPKESMQEKTQKTLEHAREPAKELEKELKEKPLLSLIPKKIKQALEIGIIAVASFFVGVAGADELALPPNTKSMLVQWEYSAYYDTTTHDEKYVRVALFYTDSTTGETLPFPEQGYFLTTEGETLWTSTTDTIHGAGPYEGVYYWIVRVKGEKVRPSEREMKGGTYHGTPQDSLFKEIIDEKWIYGESTPYIVDTNYWALDSTATVIIAYAGGTSPYFYLQIAPPTDTIYIDEIELKIIENGEIKPTKYKSGLAYPNPFNSVVTIRAGKDRVGPVRIIDSSGRKIITELVDEGEEIKWDATNFESGKYYAVWKNKDGSYTITDLTLIK